MAAMSTSKVPLSDSSESRTSRSGARPAPLEEWGPLLAPPPLASISKLLLCWRPLEWSSPPPWLPVVAMAEGPSGRPAWKDFVRPTHCG